MPKHVLLSLITSQKKLKENIRKRCDTNKSLKSDVLSRSSHSMKSYGKLDHLKSKSKTLETDKNRTSRSTDDDGEKARKRFKSVESASRRTSSQTQKSFPSQSAIKTKDSKRFKSTSNVRFDQSVTRPKFDVFGSDAHEKSKEKKSSKSNTPKVNKKASRISSNEVIRRRKKAPSKMKTSSLTLVGFDDDAGFL